LQTSGAHEVDLPSASTREPRSSEQRPKGFTHAALLQTNPGAQPSALVHVVAHEAPSLPHANGEQVVVAAAPHAPLPSQVPALVDAPSAHFATRQLVSGPASATQLLPSLPSQLVDSHGCSLLLVQPMRLPWGSPLTETHLPRLPATSHAWHWPSQLDSQQTPSTHAPEPHCPSLVQVVPLTTLHSPLCAASAHDLPSPHEATPQQTASVQNSEPLHGVVALQACPRPGAGRHAVPLQTKPAAQSVLVAQVVLHALPLHANAPHVFGTSPQ
jgi:hypothetical protein